MDHQALLNNAVMILDGKGRALSQNGKCAYFPGGVHPGCAIGCQPGFSEEFRGRIREDGIISIMCPEIAKFFDTTIDNDSDTTFLARLQMLHDAADNWDGDYWKREAVEKFCKSYPTLTVPQLDRWKNKKGKKCH